jgi:hypothetical protein
MLTSVRGRLYPEPLGRGSSACGSSTLTTKVASSYGAVKEVLLPVPERSSRPRDMIEGLKSRYRMEECSFNTIFGEFEGHRIYASRKVAEKIEIQTRYAAGLHNVDICNSNLPQLDINVNDSYMPKKRTRSGLRRI